MKIEYALSGALLALTTALILEGALGLALGYAWLIGINVFALVFYGIDKLNSKATIEQAVRIPELSLLVLALVGGSPAALVAMLLFRHKISKGGFLLPFIAVVLAQGAAVYYFRDRIPFPW